MLFQHEQTVLLPTYQFLYNTHVTVSLFRKVVELQPPWFILSFATTPYVFLQMRLTVYEAWSLETKIKWRHTVVGRCVLSRLNIAVWGFPECLIKTNNAQWLQRQYLIYHDFTAQDWNRNKTNTNSIQKFAFVVLRSIFIHIMNVYFKK